MTPAPVRPAPAKPVRALALALLLGACGERGPSPARSEDPAPGGEVWFRDEARERGLVFEHRSGHAQEFLFPELMGGGAALFDMDADGDLDAFCVQSGSLLEPGQQGGHRLFENDGTGHFVDVSAGSGVDVPGYGMGVAAGDYDADGRIDLYITNVGPNVLLRNLGGGRFEDVTAAMAVGDPAWGTSACFLDLEPDGDLDLFVTNYVGWEYGADEECFGPSGVPDYCGPSIFDAPTRDTLYRNDGEGFVDVSEEVGLGAVFGNGLGVVPADLDGDGRLDLFVANDLLADQLWFRGEDGRFVERADVAGVAVDPTGSARAGMGVDVADIDSDLDLDLIVVHMARETDGLFVNQGRYFTEETTRLGVGLATHQRTRFGVGFLDFNQDGLLDLYFSCGRVNLQMEPIDSADPYAEPNVLLRGRVGGGFEGTGLADGTLRAQAATSRGAAFGDVDGDGGVDILVVNRDAAANLLMNVVPRRGNWLSVRLVDGGRDALGAQGVFHVGEERVRRDVKPAYSYLSSCDPRLHLGLGSAQRVEALEVRWLDGARESFGPFEANQALELTRGQGR